MSALLQDITVAKLLRSLRCVGWITLEDERRRCGGRIGGATIDNGLSGWRECKLKLWGPGSHV